jgi:hypothetical protein
MKLISRLEMAFQREGRGRTSMENGVMARVIDRYEVIFLKRCEISSKRRAEVSMAEVQLMPACPSASGVSLPGSNWS